MHSRSHAASLAAPLLLVTGALGCASAHSPADAPQDAEEFLDREATALCERIRECTSVPDDASAFPPSTCQTYLRAYLEQLTRARLAALADGRVRFDPEGAQGCIEWVQGVACRPNPMSFPYPFVFDTCEWTEGAVPLGAACNSSAECTGDAYCEPGLEPGPCAGTCMPTHPEGEDCVTSTVCAEGTSCFEGTCTHLLPPTQAVSEGAPCGPVATDAGVSFTTCDSDAGLACRFDDLICVQALARGEPCDHESLPCATGLTCVGSEGTSRTCQPTEVVTAVGDACGIGEGAFCDSLAGLACTEPWGGECAATAGEEGELCMDGFPCAPGLHCAYPEGRCRPALPNGVDCLYAEECESGFCSGQCTDPHCGW